MRKILIFLTLLVFLLTGCAEDDPVCTTAPTESDMPVILETNPYTAVDFTYEGQRLVCLSADAVTGIDVSSHQGSIDWQAVAADGIEFAMIRVGYRGSEGGEINTDANARRNIEGARAAGLDVGVYFFSQAITVEEARQEAEFVVDFIADCEITMPVVFDWEHVDNEEARTAAIYDRNLLTDCALAFQETVERAGYDPMIYFNSYQADELLDLWLLRKNAFWLAHYDAAMSFPWEIAMWQYTDRGTVAGIQEKVDLNLYFP